MLLLSKDASFMLVFSWMLDEKIGCFWVSKVASFLKKKHPKMLPGSPVSSYFSVLKGWASFREMQHY